ncbi:uncharacterized protein MONOS_5964 [Monocercomonoides exilis]|uniref:uncharacterized protein n=1 Tax=Monocercomonoides exilis TaxID=2049356 RepID=UPI0035599F13|nr:hypothetical protein MONOS_5964 [Monocercomonoides exilis]|eukprot:MONOS_5964.1-p1 / transcript=MONOS_5964.1 / gene=MONOS_5964 / organism=Monocercomonoides_exilis_PA203 / gene_product=unspecified product / transcript_product=unspecified product / location=Mono_scaffold00181:8571-13102(-) / protein_length=1375 / sequence_SO=supercontig / SO=protein_coding / is_pseudo=false
MSSKVAKRERINTIRGQSLTTQSTQPFLSRDIQNFHSQKKDLVLENPGTQTTGFHSPTSPRTRRLRKHKYNVDDLQIDAGNAHELLEEINDQVFEVKEAANEFEIDQTLSKTKIEQINDSSSLYEEPVELKTARELKYKNLLKEVDGLMADAKAGGARGIGDIAEKYASLLRSEESRPNREWTSKYLTQRSKTSMASLESHSKSRPSSHSSNLFGYSTGKPSILKLQNVHSGSNIGERGEKPSSKHSISSAQTSAETRELPIVGIADGGATAAKVQQLKLRPGTRDTEKELLELRRMIEQRRSKRKEANKANGAVELSSANSTASVATQRAFSSSVSDNGTATTVNRSQTSRSYSRNVTRTPSKRHAPVLSTRRRKTEGINGTPRKSADSAFKVTFFSKLTPSVLDKPEDKVLEMPAEKVMEEIASRTAEARLVSRKAVRELEENEYMIQQQQISNSFQKTKDFGFLTERKISESITMRGLSTDRNARITVSFPSSSLSDSFTRKSISPIEKRRSVLSNYQSMQEMKVEEKNENSEKETEKDRDKDKEIEEYFSLPLMQKSLNLGDESDDDQFFITSAGSKSSVRDSQIVPRLSLDSISQPRTFPVQPLMFVEPLSSASINGMQTSQNFGTSDEANELNRSSAFRFSPRPMSSFAPSRTSRTDESLVTKQPASIWLHAPMQTERASVKRASSSSFATRDTYRASSSCSTRNSTQSSWLLTPRQSPSPSPSPGIQFSSTRSVQSSLSFLKSSALSKQLPVSSSQSTEVPSSIVPVLALTSTPVPRISEALTTPLRYNARSVEAEDRMKISAARVRVMTSRIAEDDKRAREKRKWLEIRQKEKETGLLFAPVRKSATRGGSRLIKSESGKFVKEPYEEKMRAIGGRGEYMGMSKQKHIVHRWMVAVYSSARLAVLFDQLSEDRSRRWIKEEVIRKRELDLIEKHKQEQIARKKKMIQSLMVISRVLGRFVLHHRVLFHEDYLKFLHSFLITIRAQMLFTIRIKRYREAVIQAQRLSKKYIECLDARMEAFDILWHIEEASILHNYKHKRDYNTLYQVSTTQLQRPSKEQSEPKQLGFGVSTISYSIKQNAKKRSHRSSPSFTEKSFETQLASSTRSSDAFSIIGGKVSEELFCKEFLKPAKSEEEISKIIADFFSSVNYEPPKKYSRPSSTTSRSRLRPSSRRLTKTSAKTYSSSSSSVSSPLTTSRLSSLATNKGHTSKKSKITTDCGDTSSDEFSLMYYKSLVPAPIRYSLMKNCLTALRHFHVRVLFIQKIALIKKRGSFPKRAENITKSVNEDENYEDYEFDDSLQSRKIPYKNRKVKTSKTIGFGWKGEKEVDPKLLMLFPQISMCKRIIRQLVIEGLEICIQNAKTDEDD